MVSKTGAYSASADKRTPAQWYCLLAGLGLVALGGFGFLVNGTFSEASFGFEFGNEEVNGDLFLGIEVNGWHNVVHIASGVVLLLAAASRPTARATAFAFGLIYAAVAVLGFIDGNDVLELFPINVVANILHSVLAVLALLTAAISAGTRRASAGRPVSV